VLRKVFWPKRDEVTGEWRRLHKEELHDLYCTVLYCTVIKKNEMGRASSKHKPVKVHTGFWWGNLRKTLLERPRRREKDTI
jgi:hypothetical protein